MKLSKYKILFIAAMLTANVIAAQVTGNLILNSRPPSYLSDWTNALTGQLVLNYTDSIPLNVKLNTRLLEENGNAIATSNNPTAGIIVLRRGPNIINISTVLQLQNMRFTSAANALAASGKLLPGNYQLCVQLLTVDNQTLPFQQCKLFTQVNYQLPYLLTPTDKIWLDANTAQTAIIFRWSSLVPATQDAPIYRLQVYEVQEAQTPMQALRANQPILITDLKRATQYIWRPQLSFKDSGNHVFIWTVQTLDSKGVPFVTQDANTQGRSEPRVFGITSNKEMVNKLDTWDGHISNDFKKN
jgi:hypothetical protein